MIRRLQRADAAAYRQLRLQALQTDPQVFLSTFDVEHQRPTHHFEYEVSGAMSEPCFGYYGVFLPDTTLVGFCQAAPSYLPKQTHITFLYNLYIDPNHRQQGLAHRLLTYILSELKKYGLEYVVISHVASNQAAHHLYENLGFQQTGHRPHTVKWNDKYDDEVEMMLKLT